LVKVDREADFRKSVQWGIRQGLLRHRMTEIDPPRAAVEAGSEIMSKTAKPDLGID